MVQIFAGRVQESWATAELAADAAERSGDRWCRAIVTLVRGELYHQVGDTAVAERMLADAGDAFAALGDRFCHLICVTEAAEVAELRGEYDRAIRMFEEGLAGVEGGFSAGVLAIRTRLANLEILRGNLSLAESMHREVLDHWHGSRRPVAAGHVAARPGHDRPPPRRPDGRRVHLDAAWAMGRTQTVPLMRSLALVARGATPPISGMRHALGLQVAALPVARRSGGEGGRQRGRGTRRRAGHDRRPRRRGAGRPPARPGRCHAAPSGGAMPAARALRRRPGRAPDPSAPSVTRRSRAPSRREPGRMPTRPRPTR